MSAESNVFLGGIVMKLVRIPIVFVILVLLATTAFAAPFKVGVFRFDRVAMESDAGKQAMEEVKADVKQKEDEIERRKAELMEMKDRMESEAPLLDRGALAEKKRVFRIQVNDFQAIQKQYKEEIHEFQKRIFLLMHTDVAKIATELGKEKGLDLIIEHKGIIYFEPSIDVTDELIQKYNKYYKTTREQVGVDKKTTDQKPAE